MVEADKRQAVLLLHHEGMSFRWISKHLRLSRTTVRKIVLQQGSMLEQRRNKRWEPDVELLKRLYVECRGFARRVQERLLEEERIDVKYSSLTRMLRQLGISNAPPQRCERVPDEPGAEMQHDTSVYQVKFKNGAIARVIASLLYLRYSKRRYLKFYRTFNRFSMKCFLHEAVMFWGYAPKLCVIDNTNLARLSGTGKHALITEEMEVFSAQYGFKFCCHERNHPNRKAGEERSFWTVETNFFPGRSFDNLEDLNLQALEWSTVRMDQRSQGKAGIIPAKAFEHESIYLAKLLSAIPAPYQSYDRCIDQYGYIALKGNYYWVPKISSGEVRVIEYSDRLKIYHQRQYLIEYPLPADGVRNQQLIPAGMPPPKRSTHKQKCPAEEERKLRAMGDEVSAYLDFISQVKGIRYHDFLRRAFALSRKMTSALFLSCIKRAYKYHVTKVPIIERIATFLLSEGAYEPITAELDDTFLGRETYRAGAVTDEPDFSAYEKIAGLTHTVTGG